MTCLFHNSHSLLLSFRLFWSLVTSNRIQHERHTTEIVPMKRLSTLSGFTHQRTRSFNLREKYSEFKLLRSLLSLLTMLTNLYIYLYMCLLQNSFFQILGKITAQFYRGQGWFPIEILVLLVHALSVVEHLALSV